jgi:hypothetical protein
MIREGNSIYDRIGARGLLKVLHKSLPWYSSTIYGFMTYKPLLENNEDLMNLWIDHSREHQRSMLFKMFRPRYKKIRQILADEYNIPKL